MSPSEPEDSARSPSHRVAGKVAFVPGGTGGLGEAIAWGLAEIGAKVVVGGTDAAKIAKLRESLRGKGYEAEGVVFDARSVKDIGRSVDAVCDYFGRCDILVNCVGVHREGSVLEMTEETYDFVVDLNLKAGMFLGQAVAKRQVAEGDGGKQVHLLSVRAKLGLRGKGYSAYASSKGGLLMIVRQHASELAPHRINVNGVAPTFVYTDMIGHVVQDPEFKAKVIDRIPLGRIAHPRDVVGPVQFFCTPQSDFVTGQVLYVDGGLTACQ
ncbi:MAG TPA: SDR family oxidoreductase [Polyangiaceae bacterium]|nr:SDR family oxidoreductase [Polyangiaceae bacterium]